MVKQEKHCRVIGLLVAGIDTLEVGFEISEFKLSEAEWRYLAESKEMARDREFDKIGIRVEFRGREFVISRASGPRYGYILKNDDVEIRIHEKAGGGYPYPEVHVVFRAKYLWRCGAQTACETVCQWVQSWAEVRGTKVARCDFAFDVQSPLPELSKDFHEVVTRARKCHGRATLQVECVRNRLREETIGFGESSDLKVRIYDKGREVSQSGKDWFRDIWKANGWEEGEEVTRVEFQCRGRFLRTMQTCTAEELFDHLPDIARYLTQKWFTIRVPGTDSHRHRWAISDFWVMIQNAVSKFGMLSGVSRLRQKRPRLERLKAQARGLLVSIVALDCAGEDGKTTEAGQGTLWDLILAWLNDDHFLWDVQRRRALHASMTP